MMIGALIGWQGAAFALFAALRRAWWWPCSACHRPQAHARARELDGGGDAPDAPPDAAARGAEAATDAPAQDEDAEGRPRRLDPPPAWIGHLKLPFGPSWRSARSSNCSSATCSCGWLELAARALPRLVE